MDKYNLKDALLFISRGDTHEILIETNQRTRPDVQSNLQELLKLYPDINPKVVSCRSYRRQVRMRKTEALLVQNYSSERPCWCHESREGNIELKPLWKSQVPQISIFISEPYFLRSHENIPVNAMTCRWRSTSTGLFTLRNSHSVNGWCHWNQFLPSKGAGCAPVPTINAKNRNIWCTLQSQTYRRRSDCSYAPDTRWRR